MLDLKEHISTLVGPMVQIWSIPKSSYVRDLVLSIAMLRGSRTFKTWDLENEQVIVLLPLKGVNDRILVGLQSVSTRVGYYKRASLIPEPLAGVLFSQSTSPYCMHSHHGDLSPEVNKWGCLILNLQPPKL